MESSMETTKETSMAVGEVEGDPDGCGEVEGDLDGCGEVERDLDGAGEVEGDPNGCGESSMAEGRARWARGRSKETSRTGSLCRRGLWRPLQTIRRMRTDNWALCITYHCLPESPEPWGAGGRREEEEGGLMLDGWWLMEEERGRRIDDWWRRRREDWGAQKQTEGRREEGEGEVMWGAAG
jgi:hypothetical protein